MSDRKQSYLDQLNLEIQEAEKFLQHRKNQLDLLKNGQKEVYKLVAVDLKKSKCWVRSSDFYDTSKDSQLAKRMKLVVIVIKEIEDIKPEDWHKENILDPEIKLNAFTEEMLDQQGLKIVSADIQSDEAENWQTGTITELLVEESENLDRHYIDIEEKEREPRKGKGSTETIELFSSDTQEETREKPLTATKRDEEKKGESLLEEIDDIPLRILRKLCQEKTSLTTLHRQLQKDYPNVERSRVLYMIRRDMKQRQPWSTQKNENGEYTCHYKGINH